MFSRVTAVRAYERVVEQVEEAIAAGRLRPGDRLPSERQLMAELGVGRSTVREALRVLSSKGLVRSRPGDPSGPLVLPFSADGLREQVVLLARADFLTLRELLQFRMTVEGAAHRLAAASCTSDQLAGLELLVLDLEACVGDPPAFAAADQRFGCAVAEAASNALLSICVAVLRDAVQRVAPGPTADDSAERRTARCRQRRGVLTALRAGDPDRASSLVRESIHDDYAPRLDDADRRALADLLDGALTGSAVPHPSG